MLTRLIAVAGLLTTAALFAAPAGAQNLPIPLAGVGITEELGMVLVADFVVGGGANNLYCERPSSSDDNCSDSTGSSFSPNKYLIWWCVGGTCSGISGATDGTIDMLRGSSGDLDAWCVNVQNGVYNTACTASWSSTNNLRLGDVASYSHDIDGWFAGRMTRA